MNPNYHAAFTGSSVAMNNQIDDCFSSYNGYCTGYNIELIPGKLIVQAWHFDEQGWPQEHYSICTFRFEEADHRTKLIFKQTGVPEHCANALKQGWKDYYWKPMKELLKTLNRSKL